MKLLGTQTVSDEMLCDLEDLIDGKYLSDKSLSLEGWNKQVLSEFYEQIATRRSECKDWLLKEQSRVPEQEEEPFKPQIKPVAPQKRLPQVETADPYEAFRLSKLQKRDR